MEINQQSLEFLFKTGDMRFQEALSESPRIYDDVCTQVPVSGNQITMAWLDRVPYMREWIGARTINSMVTRARTIDMKPYEATISIGKQDMEDDEDLAVGLFGNGVQMLGEAAAKNPDILLADFIRVADAVEGYDGVAVYDTAHPTDGGTAIGLPSSAPATQSNLNTNFALTYDNFGLAREQMRSWVGADGQPMQVIPDTLMVSSHLETEARQILQSDFLPATGQNAPQTNIWKDAVKLIVNPFLDDKGDNWWLLDSSKAIRPYAHYLRQAPQFTYLTNPTDANVFFNKEFLYGVDSREAASETVWWLSLACTAGGSY